MLAPALRAMGAKRFVDWSFGHYLRIAAPEFAAAAGRVAAGRTGALSPAASV
jgi:hypothetical protein